MIKRNVLLTIQASILIAMFWCAMCATALATKSWDGRHDTSKIDVTVVYFVPADRQPLPDWRERLDYFSRRIELFHQREFQSQSTMKATVHAEPLISELTTAKLREGNADAIFFKTLRETDRRLKFAEGDRESFPILLVLSEINWRPLDDFFRLHPQDGALVFEGNYNRGEHFPGATSGGARATYLADRGVGWGLVSADGWRVPYRGSDCVVYHEGCGHTVGLPHPEPGNGSVMSMGQYHGWISESWLDRDQKARMKWEPEEVALSDTLQLFSDFRAIPDPKVPAPGQAVKLKLDWPEKAKVKSLRLQYQTSVIGPWQEVPATWDGDAPQEIILGTFDRPTPISYRVDVELHNGAKNELWGYLQVREAPDKNPQPLSPSLDLLSHLIAATDKELTGDQATLEQAVDKWVSEEVDLLAQIDPEKQWSQLRWTKGADGKLESPKGYGARIEVPGLLPAEYRLTAIIEPLDTPNGFLLGQRLGNSRFVTLFNYAAADDAQPAQSAIENIDGVNVGNATTFVGNLFKQNQLSQVIVTVTAKGVRMSVDGKTIVNWKGDAKQLSLSEYWSTPDEQALFIGAYDCRYRIHRLTLQPLTQSSE
jgi:hypothetical protein